MSFSKNSKQSLYWVNVLKLAIFLIIIISLFSVIFKTGSALFSGDFETVYNFHFANKLWMRFFLPKVVVSFLYAVYVVNKRMK